jgi:hypothetical protein
MHGIAGESDGDGTQAVGRGIEAAASPDVEFPSVAGTFEDRACEGPLGERPEGMRTSVLIGKYTALRMDEQQIRAVLLDVYERIDGKIGE